MAKITGSELALLRTRPHRSELKLWFYRPPTIMAAQVSDALIARYAISITFGSVTAGAYTDINEGMTMYVGTAPGKADLGRVRVRSSTDTVLTVARNSISWANGCYLTVVDFYEIWPRFIREVQSGTSTIHYKDHDIAYTSQNSLMGTLMSVGSHAVVDAGQSLYWSSSGTVQTEEMPLNWMWTFGGTVIADNTPEPGWVQYLTPGYYTTKVVANPTGTAYVDTTYRHVIVAGGSVQPYLKFGFDSLDGSRDQGGWVAKIWLKEDSLPEVMEGSLVIITADNWYGTTKQSIGGNSTNRQNVLFVGYIIDNSITYDYINSRMEFSLVSPTGRMKLESNSSMEIDSAVLPANWYEVHELNGKKAIYHYLKWHSTLLNCCDMRWTADDRPMKTVQGETATLYDVVNNIMLRYLVGEMVSDRQAAVWFEKHPMAVHTATSVYNSILDMDRQDWMNEIGFDESFLNQVSYLEMGGLGYSGAATGTWSDFLSGFPGDNLKGYFGKTDLIQGHYVYTQEENNVLVGDVFAYKNALYPNLNLEVAGWYSLFDIAPEEIINLTLNQADTYRGTVWNKKGFFIRDISIDHKAGVYNLLPKLSLHEVTQGTTGETVPIINPGTKNWPGVGPFPPFNPTWPTIPNPVPLPYIPPVLPKPPTALACWGNVNAPTNGPFDTGMSGTIDDTGGVIALYGPIKMALRSINAVNQSRYQLWGIFQKRAVDSSDWVDTLDNDFYNVYAAQTTNGYQRVAVASNLPAVVTGMREGVFLSPSDLNIDQLELSLSSPEKFTGVSGSIYGDGGVYCSFANVSNYASDDGGAYQDASGMMGWRNVVATTEGDCVLNNWSSILHTGIDIHFPAGNVLNRPIVWDIDITLYGPNVRNDGSGTLTIENTSDIGGSNYTTALPIFGGGTTWHHSVTLTANSNTNHRAVYVDYHYDQQSNFTYSIILRAHMRYQATRRIILNKAYLYNMCEYHQ